MLPSATTLDTATDRTTETVPAMPLADACATATGTA
jgi:hypothetical protein